MYYQDFSVASSSEIKGIGYALYLKLADPETGEDRAGLAVYYDIPLGGTKLYQSHFRDPSGGTRAMVQGFTRRQPKHFCEG